MPQPPKSIFSKDNNQFRLFYKDVSLDRIYNILYVYCCLYDDYSFSISRFPSHYLLAFKAWRKNYGGVYSE